MVDKSEYLRDQHWVKTLHAGVMGGAYVGMAGLLSLMVGGNITSNFINQKAHGCPFVGVALFRLGFGPKESSQLWGRGPMSETKLLNL